MPLIIPAQITGGRGGCYPPPSAVFGEEGVGRLTEVLFTAPGNASFLLSGKGRLPYSAEIPSVNRSRPRDSYLEMKDFESLVVFFNSRDYI